MARTITIRRSLLTNLSVMILGLCLAILAVTLYTGREIVRGASSRLIEQALGRAGSELQTFFEPLEPNLRLARQWVETGLIDIEDDEVLNRFFVPVLETYPQISSVNFGDGEGRAWTLLRLPGGWLNRRVDPTRFGERILYREWRRGGGPVRERWVEAPGPEERYDPRTRDWFVSATEGAAEMEPGVERPALVYWTEPYVFFTTSDPGITAAAHARTPDGRKIILAFDVLLSDLSEATRGIEVSPNGYVAVLSEDRQLLGLPRHPYFEDPEARSEALLRRPLDLGIDVFDDAIATRQALGLPVMPESAADSLFSFESGHQTYWAGSRVVTVPPRRRFLMVVAIPERDLVGPVHQLRAGVLVATLLALVAAVLSAFQLARRYGRPLAALARSSARIRRLDLRATDPLPTRLREVAELAQAQDRMRSALDAFSRYVPTDVVRELVELGEAARIGGEEKDLTVLFTDVQGFTSIAEHMTPEDLTLHLAGYFEELIGIIDHTGTVDKLVGDGIMAFWGAPYPDPHHARHAVEAVLACLDSLDRMNDDWRASGEPPLPTRFGIASGPAVVGNVGSPRRLSYTAVGDVVNLASRLEGLNRIYGTRVLAADPVPRLAGKDSVWRAVDRVRVAGRTQTAEVFELLGRAGEVPRARIRFASRYEEALRCYRSRSFEQACALLVGLPESERSDKSVVRLRTTCERLVAEPPGPDWSDVTVLEQK